MGRFAVLFWWILVLPMSLSMSARAANVDWLYDVDVPVADQSVGVRATASKQALLIVLKRLSGLSTVPQNAAVTLALESPQRYYVEYRYREEAGPTPTATKVLLLSLRFAQPAMQRLIVDANLPLWSSNRPTTVAWIVVTEGADRTVLGASDTHPLLDALRTRSRERGLPLVVPLMDLDEQVEVTDAVVWGALSGVLETASARYAPEQILVGRISHGAANSWVGEWQLWTHADKQRFTIESASAAAEGSAVADRLIDSLVARYVVDHSWDSYLDDFIEKAHGGLTLAWGSGVGFPPTRFLVLDGASHGRQFKAWARHSMAVSRFWFSAYKDYTVDQIERNTRIADGLRRTSLKPKEAVAWAQDL